MGALILREKIIFIGIIAFFLWISFFAPTVSLKWWVMPVSILSVFLLGFRKNYFKLIFCKKEVCFLIFLLTMGFGITSAKDLSVASRHFWFFIFPVPFLYFFGKIAFKQKYSMAIIKSLCIMASLVSIYGIIEFISKQNFIYDKLIDNIYYLKFIGRRMMSTHINPVPLATYFVAVLPLAVMLSLKEKKTVFKALAFIYTALISIGVFLTVSRGAFLSALIGVTIIAISFIKMKRMVFISLVIILVLLIIGFGALLSHYVDSPFSRYMLTPICVRFNYSLPRLEMSIKVLKDHPLIGIGFGNYRVLFDFYLSHLKRYVPVPFDYKVADCMYMTILTETGLLGFSGFALFLLFLFKRIKEALHCGLDNEKKIYLLSFLAGFVSIMCAFLTYDGLYWIAPNYLFWSYAGILSSLLS